MGREPTFKCDPIEFDPKFAWMVRKEEKEAEAEVEALGDLPHGMGSSK